MKKVIAMLFFLLAAAAIVFVIMMPSLKKPPEKSITNFQECAAAGNTVMESYPRQCTLPNGKFFVEQIVPQK